MRNYIQYPVDIGYFNLSLPGQISSHWWLQPCPPMRSGVPTRTSHSNLKLSSPNLIILTISRRVSLTQSLDSHLEPGWMRGEPQLKVPPQWGWVKEMEN